MRLTFLLFALYAGHSAAATLEGIAVLAADTFMPGPVSGQFIGVQEGLKLPFEGQPVQGFSAVISNGDGSFLALSDNGFGSRANSPDFLLRIYSIEPEFRTAEGGSGEIRINGYINLGDPRGFIDYPIVSGFEFHEAPEPRVAVESAVRELRLLTGSDLDPESLQRAPDGSLWIGEEFGPFLAHFNEDGDLLEPLHGLKRLNAEGRPLTAQRQLQAIADEERVANLPASRGFEGMAMSADGRFLYPMLEGALAGQQGILNIYTFDLESGAFVNPDADAPSYRYRPEPGATAIGDFTLYAGTLGLVIERDSGEGAGAGHKRIFKVDLERLDENGFLVKKPVADLLSIDDPHDLDGDGSEDFAFPHKTPEAVIVMDRNTIGVINDNNYPFGRARDAGGRQPDGTEFILLGVSDLW